MVLALRALGYRVISVSDRTRVILETSKANPGMKPVEIATIVGGGCTTNMVVGALYRAGLDHVGLPRLARVGTSRLDYPKFV